jgi:hypothetical protein
MECGFAGQTGYVFTSDAVEFEQFLRVFVAFLRVEVLWHTVFVLLYVIR